MGVGALLVVIGGSLTLRQGSTVGQVTVAALTAIGSTVSGYISKTFLRSYEISVRQAERYFREPLVAGYLLAAERIASQLPSGDQKSQALTTVVRGVLDATLAAARSEPTAEMTQEGTERQK
jgi:hypothetical protein